MLYFYSLFKNRIRHRVESVFLLFYNQIILFRDGENLCNTVGNQLKSAATELETPAYSTVSRVVKAVRKKR